MVISTIIFILIAGFILWELVYSIYFFKKGKILSKNNHIKNIKVGNKSKTILKLLIAGDSIGVGVGASVFETTVAARIAYYLAKNDYVFSKNISVNGSKMEDLLTNKIPKEKFNLAIIFISSNDVLRFTDLNNFEKNSTKAIEKYSKISKRLIVIGPANVGLATVLPIILRVIYLYTAPKYASVLKKSCEKFKNVIYINSLKPPRKLGKYKQGYYSLDMFHPNDAGYRFWLEMVKPYL